jgi:hypothetical protein
MITKQELLQGRDKTYKEQYTKEVSDNLDKMLSAINVIRKAYAKPMTPTSGWRPPAVNASTPGAAPNSAHCVGLAVDISDPDGKLWAWVLNNLQLIKDCGVYVEDKRWTPTWVHFGLKKPASGKRIFIPSVNRALAPDAWDGKYDPKFD